MKIKVVDHGGYCCMYLYWEGSPYVDIVYYSLGWHKKERKWFADYKQAGLYFDNLEFTKSIDLSMWPGGDQNERPNT